MNLIPTNGTPAGTGLLPAAQPARPGERAPKKRSSSTASDYLPVFLIKEIRQSLRSRRFMRSFIGVQLLLQAFTFLALIQTGGLLPKATSDLKVEEEMLNIIFWLILSLPLLIIPPLTVMMGMGRVLKDKSLDLVFMTSLSAWRAVIGIWLSYLAEGMLLTLAALPYLLLRYYLGGVDLIQQLCLFGLLLVGSSLLTAITLGLSTYRHLLVRLVILLLAVGLGLIASGLMVWLVSEFRPYQLMDWHWAVFLSLMLPLIGWMFLRLAASHLCPPAESHSAHLRLGTLALLLLSAIIQLDNPFPVLIVFMALITPLLTEPLCEPFRAIGPLYIQPGARFGGIRRRLGGILYSGWPAGLNFLFAFYALLILLCLIGYFVEGGSDDQSLYMFLYPLRLATGQALTIFGAALFQKLRHPLREPTQAFFGITFILQLLYMMVVMSMSNIIRDDTNALVYLAPMAGAIRSLSDYSASDTINILAYILYPLGTVISYFTLSALARPAWRAIRAIEKGQPLPQDALALPVSLVEPTS